MADTSAMSPASRRVSSRLVLEIDGPVRLDVQVAAAMAPSEETLDITCDGVLVDVAEVPVAGVGRVHVCDPPSGRLVIAYEATVPDGAATAAVTEAERIIYRRPSRYAES